MPRLTTCKGPYHGILRRKNQFYRENPKRAGNKIWDKQRFDFDKLAGGLFKRM
jgi:hypothetical protein